MPLRIDSKAVILAMTKDPGTFPTVITALDKDITKYLTAHFKDKSMQLDRLKATHDALGAVEIELIFESLDEKTITALLKKVDPHSGAVQPNAALESLRGLASGRIEPQPKPEKAGRAVVPRIRAPLKRAGADKAAAARGIGTRPVDAGEPPPAETGAPAKRQRAGKKAAPKAE